MHDLLDCCCAHACSAPLRLSLRLAEGAEPAAGCCDGSWPRRLAPLAAAVERFKSASPCLPAPCAPCLRAGYGMTETSPVSFQTSTKGEGEQLGARVGAWLGDEWNGGPGGAGEAWGVDCSLLCQLLLFAAFCSSIRPAPAAHKGRLPILAFCPADLSIGQTFTHSRGALGVPVGRW